MNLHDAKLFRPRDKRMDWAKIKKNFKLINEEVNVADPLDISYVYNGYSPLSVMFVEAVMLNHGFKNVEDRVKMLPGQSYAPLNDFDFYQSTRPGMPDAGKKKKVMIYFIGGVTYAEIAAIRFLNKVFTDKQFLIATTEILNNERTLAQFKGDLTNNLDVQALLRK
mmetsp:Transcript_19602/g.14315  ORF Transcript_19602/g.14315 Transcript_19602/m.14315 type:complete len:166 (+) Transcript_19602:45-542(+)